MNKKSPGAVTSNPGEKPNEARQRYIMHRGYVKVWRKMEDSGFLQDQGACQFFLWALFKATHKPRKHIVGNQVVNLEPGQFVSGRHAASEELGISPSKFVRTVEKMKNIEFVDTKPNNKFTIFTIIKWDTYQNSQTASGQQTEQQTDNSRTTVGQQSDTNKNVKNIKNEEIYIPEHLSEYADFARNFQNHVKGINGAKAPTITDVLIKKCAEEVDKLIRIDGHPFEQIKSTMRWAVKDEFWASNAMSLAALRKKGDDGRTKFQKILAAKDRSVPTPHMPGAMLTAEQIKAMCAVN